MIRPTDHLAHRDQQQRGVNSGEGAHQREQKAEVQTKAGAAEVVEETVDASDGPDATPVDGDTGATDKELAQWLGPWWRKRHQLKRKFTEAMTSYKPIQIRNFLRKDKALALHRSITFLCKIPWARERPLRSFRACSPFPRLNIWLGKTSHLDISFFSWIFCS